jgi:hypothetical protein
VPQRNRSTRTDSEVSLFKMDHSKNQKRPMTGKGARTRGLGTSCHQKEAAEAEPARKARPRRRDEPRRITANIAKLPKLLRRLSEHRLSRSFRRFQTNSGKPEQRR